VQQSNAYVITFSVVLTIVLGLLLSGTSEVLKPIQQKAEALDTKKQILGAVIPASDIAAMKPDEIDAFYESRISSKVVDIDGEEVTEVGGVTITAESVDVGKNYKKIPAQRLYPVFIFHEEGNTEGVISYIFPVYGNGLWDNIWGYLALQTDVNTIEGVTFSHAGETPGLGARITSRDVQGRYEGKQIFDGSGNLVSVDMQKGEGRDYSGEDHKVDGLSGATITAVGVNNMLRNYLQSYKAYMDRIKQGNGIALN
jgi:Na+-transporting NADH:ubiquinone oxidoreductase subunit C